jgi:hypothetical protein
VTTEHVPTDHRAEAQENLRSVTNLGGYPQDGDSQTIAGLLAAMTHALLDIGDQMRANAPVQLEPLLAEPVQFAEMPLYPGPCPASQPLAEELGGPLLCTLRAGHAGDHEHQEDDEPGLYARWSQ